jgi:hypothetical protein
MRISKRFTVILVFAFLCIGVHAKSKTKITMPARNQIVLVGRVSLNRSVDDFYAKTFRGANAATPDFVTIKLAENSCVIPEEGVEGANGGEFFFITLDKNEKIAVRIKGFAYRLYGVEEAYISLPFWKEFTVPLDGQFFYIGSLVYTVEGMLLDVTSVDSIDEYDAAQIAVNKRYNREIPFRRVPLNDLAEY